MKYILYSLVLFFFPINVFSQFTWNTKEIHICKFNNSSQFFEDCETYREKALIRINEENTTLNLITSSYKRNFYINNIEKDKELDVLILELIEDDGEDFFCVLDENKGEFRIMYKVEYDTYMTIFKL